MISLSQAVQRTETINIKNKVLMLESRICPEGIAANVCV